MSSDDQQSGEPTDLPSAEAILARLRLDYEAIQALAASIKASVESASESQLVASAAATDIGAKLAELTSMASTANAAMTKIVDAQSVIASKSEHIEGAQGHADRVRAELDKLLTAVTQSATQAEAGKQEASASSASTNELLAQVRAARASSDTELSAIGKARESAMESEEQLKKLATRSTEVDRKLSDYEVKIKELQEMCTAQLETITNLLPGATSAGLAHAFDQRRKSFIDPGKRWQWLFVGAVLSLVVLAITGLWHVYNSEATLTYDQLVRLWLARLPIAGALVWLAIHASRESALAKRLEEDYGYKAAVAASFQGFHRQMTEVGVVAAGNVPLAKLCEDTLTTIASPPGRIYDKHSLITSPSEELTKVARSALDGKTDSE